jgi:hypothetical protein
LLLISTVDEKYGLNMYFYKLSKKEREAIVRKIQNDIKRDIQNDKTYYVIKYFSDLDTYIRKTAYLAIGKIFKTENINPDNIILRLIN